MMKKALWALALLFLVSGCNDDDYETPPRYDRMVSTTFTFEYDFAYVDAPSQALTVAPEMPEDMNFRVVMDIYEWLEDSEHPGSYTYRFYDQKRFIAREHVLGDNGKLYVTGDLNIDKMKFTAVIWGDYTRASSPNADNLYTTVFSRNFLEEETGLRYVYLKDPSSRDELLQDGLSGIQTFDFTPFESENNAVTAVTISMNRALAQFTLIANDLEEYKNSIAAPNTYEGNMNPRVIRFDYGASTIETPLAGYRNTFDGLFQWVGSQTTVNRLITYTPEEDGSEMLLANDWLFADLRKEKQEVIVSILGPMDLVLSKFKIQIPLERNKKTVIKAPFLTGDFETSVLEDYGITIIDD